MKQKTNLNTSPYYDDFDQSKNYYKVLYKPGFPVQARELTSSQSILQNQLDKFSSYVFKDGVKVIPGDPTFNDNVRVIKLNATNFGVDISLYIKNLVDKTIVGESSGISATVTFVTSVNTSENNNQFILFVNQTSSGNSFDRSNTFIDGESISCTENIVYGNTTINVGTPLASLISPNSTGFGSLASIDAGVYYVRGYFVNVDQQTIVLDPFNNNPSYRVGLNIEEKIVNAKEDNSLYDNASGFTNFAAPGADRLQIKLSLTKKLLTDKNDNDFIMLLEVKEGQIKKVGEGIGDELSLLGDVLATRTFEESGNYSVKPFKPSVHNSLNNKLANNGLFFSNQLTDQGNIPSNDLMCIKISPGLSYVRGYRCNKNVVTILDVDKPRDVGIQTNSAVDFKMGNVLRINNVRGIPKQGEVVKLHDNLNTTGDIIGSARVYSFNLEDAPYEDESSIWNLRLFDIQTFTKIEFNSSISGTEVPSGSFIKGKNSNASGFVNNHAGGTLSEITLSETSGTFMSGEELTVNGIDLSRTIDTVTANHTQQIKSVSQPTSTGFPNISGDAFRSDTFLEKFKLPGGITNASITAEAGSTSTLTAFGEPFSGLRVGSIIRYNKPGQTIETFNKVTNVSDDSLTITLSQITPDVTNVFEGSLPTSDIVVEVKAGAPIIRGNGELFERLNNSNIESVDLSSSNLTVTKQIPNKTVSSGSLTLNASSDAGLSDSNFIAFDQERYSIHNDDGTIQALNNDNFSTDGTNFTLTGLANDTVTVSSTLTKNVIKSKLKVYNKSQSYIISLSNNKASGDGGLDDGLTFDSRYGLRVQDNEISLNYPDVVKVIAIFESLDKNNPILDTISFTDIANIDNLAIIGEDITCDDKAIVARIISKPATNQLSIVYLTSEKFQPDDSVTFSESNIKTRINTIVNVSKYKDLTSSYRLDKGQRNQYYDYSRLVRNKNVIAPSKKVFILFDYYSVPENDTGDVFTVLSYNKERYDTDIPKIGSSQVRASDTIDFRPRVPVYDPSSGTTSPFSFSSRDFSAITNFVTPNESFVLNYNFYLPRVDNLYMGRNRQFIYEKGVSSINPKPPLRNDELMKLATITFPPYLFNPEDARIVISENKRFTMKDIGTIEDRVQNLEEVTSLSLLETNVQSLQILDSEGRNRFKSGFFVDPFRNHNFVNRKLSEYEINTNNNTLLPKRSHDTLRLVEKLKDPGIVDSELFDSNCKKTGNIITLNYEEVEWINQRIATTTINVNPFTVPTYRGIIKLTPASDSWTRTIENDDKKIIKDGINSTQNVNLNTQINGDLTGNLGQTIEGTTSYLELSPSQARSQGLQQGRNEIVSTQSSTVTGQLSFNGNASDSVTVSNVDTTIDNRLVSSGSVQFMRSRNVQFVTESFPAYTQFYTFLDKQVVDFIPKLVEVTPIKNGVETGTSGSAFVIGEDVEVYDDLSNAPVMKFKVCKPNHKDGEDIVNPTETYKVNPYAPSSTDENAELLPSNYSLTTPIVNIDTASLVNDPNYYGYLETGFKLIGKESNAVAFVKNLRLISDDRGDLIGTFFIKDPLTTPPPAVRFNTGTKTFLLTTSSTNASFVPGVDPDVFAAETTFVSEGTKLTFEKEIIETINSTTFNINSEIEATIDTNINVDTDVVNIVEVEYCDPLAQTFIVGSKNPLVSSANNRSEDNNGAFLTAVEIFFKSVDPTTGVTLQIRKTTEGSRPSTEILREVYVDAVKNIDGVDVTFIETSDDASKGFKFVLDEPLHLEANNFYAITLLAPDTNKYIVHSAIQGQNAVNPQSIPGAEGGASIQYSQDSSLGSIFKSQNAALWTEDNTQDLTYVLYKAKFVENGSLILHNEPLTEGNDYVKKLIKNPITTFPKTGSIGITSIALTNTSLTSLITTGRRICGLNSTSTAVITGVGGSVTAVSKTNGGLNYATGQVETFAITGDGSGLTLNISGVDADGAITSVGNPTSPIGIGYKVGDVVGIKTSTVGTKGGQGRGAEITITQLDNINKLFLTNIKGDNTSFPGGVGVGLSFFNNSNQIVSLASTTIVSNNFNTAGTNSGNLFQVRNLSHGMHSPSNKLELKNIRPDTVPTELSSDLSDIESSKINVVNTSGFDIFEGAPVSGLNTGYVKINNEIIGYDGVGVGELNIASGANGRSIDDTISVSHKTKDLVIKYELNGVSLRRLQRNDLNVSQNQIELDNYFVEFDRSKNGKNRSSDDGAFPQLSFNSLSATGGNEVRSSRNILFNGITPHITTKTPIGFNDVKTSITASMRTISATSVSGSEISFLDEGFESISLNNYNTVSNMRMIASQLNEIQYLTGLPENKSFNLLLNMTTNNENLSPIVYMDKPEPNIELISNRINQPIGLENYDTNENVNSIINDPHASLYVSNTVRLSKPATSLKVLLSANRPDSADFRVLYSLNRVDSENTDQAFELFPGFKNLTNVDPDDGFGDVVIDPAKNDGRPDSFVPSNISNQFSEYQFTADNLDEFIGYTIKIVMSSTDQSKPPTFKELRSIAVR